MSARAQPEATHKRFGSRVSRIRAGHSFRPVLGLITISFFFACAVPDSTWSSSMLLLLQGATLVVALWTAGVARADSKLSISLATIAVGLAAAVVIVGGTDLLTASALLSGCLVVATMAAIALGVLDQTEVNQQSVTGAVCFYILLGMAFLFLYGAIAQLGSAPFFSQGTDGTRTVRTYFSYVTLATLGYGDYTPAGSLGRTLAVVEAILGQLYLVTVVAVIVSRLGTTRRKRSPFGAGLGSGDPAGEEERQDGGDGENRERGAEG